MYRSVRPMLMVVRGLESLVHIVLEKGSASTTNY